MKQNSIPESYKEACAQLLEYRSELDRSMGKGVDALDIAIQALATKLKDEKEIHELREENERLRAAYEDAKNNCPGRKTKYSVDDKQMMYKMRNAGTPCADIAKKYECTVQYVYRICREIEESIE